MYCFGVDCPKRLPRPAATTRAIVLLMKSRPTVHEGGNIEQVAGNGKSRREPGSGGGEAGEVIRLRALAPPLLLQQPLRAIREYARQDRSVADRPRCDCPPCGACCAALPAAACR